MQYSHFFRAGLLNKAGNFLDCRFVCVALARAHVDSSHRVITFCSDFFESETMTTSKCIETREEKRKGLDALKLMFNRRKI